MVNSQKLSEKGEKWQILLTILQYIQFAQVARIYKGRLVYTGGQKKLPVFRLYFCNFAPIFGILGLQAVFKG